MNRTHALAVAAAIALVSTGFSSPTLAATGDDPVLVTGIASCDFNDVQAHIGPSGSVTYKIYGSCSGSTVSGQVAYSNGKFQESYIISNQAKISTMGYCDTDPWATAVNCHDQIVQSSSINYDPGLADSAPLSLISGYSAQRFHEAFLHASRPNPPGIPVNLTSTYALDPVNPGSSSALDRVTAKWLAPDATGDRPFLGFLMQVRPQHAEGAAWTDIGTIAWHAALDYRLTGKFPANTAIPAWEVRVCSTTALTMSCSPPQIPSGGELTTMADSHGSNAAAALFAARKPTSINDLFGSGKPAPVKALGRVETDSGGPTMTICEAAASAKARNSPAAPGLEKQCAAQPPKPAPPVLDEAWRNDNAAKGAALAEQDPLATELRNAIPEGAGRNGFDFGMAVAEGQTMPGPGKQAIHDALNPDEQFGFELGVRFSLDRNANADLAAKGAAIMLADPAVAAVRDAAGESITREVRTGDQAVFYKLGYNIATGIFGDPALGALGHTLVGPGSTKIRNALAAGYEQSGFDAAVSYHLARDYSH